MKKSILVIALLTCTAAFSQVSIGTTNPQQFFHIDGAKNNPTTGTPSAAQSTDDFVVTAGGSVGIGTISPSQKLTVNGTTGLLGAIYRTNGAGGTEFFITPRESDGFTYLNMAPSGMYMRSNDNTIRMTLLNNGNVGIGTNSPLQQLHATAGIRAGSSGNGYAELIGGDANSGYVGFNKQDGTRLGYIGYSTTNMNYVAENGANHIFNGGYVGIGTSSPVSKIHITGSTSGNWSNGITLEAGGRIFNLSTRDDQGSAFIIADQTSGSIRFRIDITGNISLGQVVSAAKLDVTGVKPSAGNGTGANNDAPTQVIIPAGNNGVTRRLDWPSGWGGGLSTHDIVGASTFFTTYSTRSDRKLKENILALDENVLKQIMNLKPVTYYLKEKTPETSGLQYGFIAQEVREVFPSIVTKTDDEVNGTIGMNYQALISPLVKVVQMQQNDIETLKEKIEQLLKEVENLKNK